MSLKYLLLSAAICFMSAVQLHATTVAENISRSPSIQYGTIQDAIAAASSGETILIYPGTHTGLISISGKSINLVSRYYLDGDSTWRDQTILDGNQAGGIVSLSGSSVTYRFTGLTFKNAKDVTAFKTTDMNTVEVRKCVFENNVYNPSTENDGIIRMDFATGLFEDVIIRNNTASLLRSCIIIQGGSYTFRNVKIVNNTAYKVLTDNFSDIKLENVSICNNSNQIDLNQGSPFTVFGNCTATLNHSTIAGNYGVVSFRSYEGEFSAHSEINNSIIWGSKSGNQVSATDVASITIKNSAVKGNAGGVSVGSGVGSNINIVSMTDPLFSISASGDYDLSNSSPCLTKAAITSLGKDIRGIRRPPIPKGTYPDLGAYENLSNDNTSGALNWNTKVIFPSINNAVAAASAYDTIIALEGTHTQTVNIDKSLVLASPFLLSGDTSSVSKTVIDGQNIRQNIICELPGGNDIQIIGISVKRGYSTLRGAGIYVRNQKSFTTKKCMFDANRAEDEGAGLYCFNSEKITIEDCIFKGNTSQLAAAIGVTDNDHFNTHLTTVRNILVCNNFCTNSLIDLDAADIDNMTCVDNTFGTSWKYALSVIGRTVDVRNSIIWNALSSNTIHLFGNEKNVIADCCVNGGTSVLTNGGSTSSPIQSSNILSTNPLFINNYHLSSSSPCVGTGGPSPTVKDLDGVLRVGKYCDMGCYENPSSQNFVAENVSKGGLLYTSINSAVAAASQNDTILIYPGVHKERLNFDTPHIGINLISMFCKTGDSSYIANTIIDGEQKGCTINFSTHYTGSIEGMTVRGGYTTSFGSAIYGPAYSTLKVKNCIIENNSGTSAIIYSSENLTLENSILRNNNSSEKVIWCRNSHAELLNCRITHNNGVPFHACACINDAQSSGVKLQNVLIDNNKAKYAMVNIEAQATELNHLTIVNNSFNYPSSAATLNMNYMSGKERPVSLKNSILWNPLSPKEINWVNPTSCRIDNSVVRNGINGGTINASVISVGTGIPFTYSKLTALTPLFINDAGENFHLQTSSPLLDAGLPSSLSCDLDKNNRPAPAASLPDIGCYEHNYIDTGLNLPPVMTGNTTPWGITSCNSTYSTTNPAWKAFDGDEAGGSSSQWISGSGLPSYIGFEFPFATPVVRYFILPDYTTKNRTPKSWQLQGYNETNGTWITLDSRTAMRTDQEWSAAGLNLSITSSGLYKKYRLYITETNGASITAIRSLKLYSPTDICPIMYLANADQFAVTASSELSSTFPAWKAFDGNDLQGASSRWISSSSSSFPAWISWEFVTYKTPNCYYIQAEYGLNDRAPNTWSLQGWNDATSSWVTIDSRSGITDSQWTFYGQYFKIANPGSYRKYRLLINSVNGSSVVSLLKVKLFKL